MNFNLPLFLSEYSVFIILLVFIIFMAVSSLAGPDSRSCISFSRVFKLFVCKNNIKVKPIAITAISSADLQTDQKQINCRKIAISAFKNINKTALK